MLPVKVAHESESLFMVYSLISLVTYKLVEKLLNEYEETEACLKSYENGLYYVKSSNRTPITATVNALKKMKKGMLTSTLVKLDEKLNTSKGIDALFDELLNLIAKTEGLKKQTSIDNFLSNIKQVKEKYMQNPNDISIFDEFIEIDIKFK